MIVVEVFAGAASARFRSMPLGRKTGTDFAEAVISDDQERSDFLDGTLADERLSSPGCVMDGRIDGVSQIGAMGMIVANMRAECDHVPEKLRAVFFSGYDGLCLYRDRVMWLGWAGLSIRLKTRYWQFWTKYASGSSRPRDVTDDKNVDAVIGDTTTTQTGCPFV
jgi:hypothetical protein